MISIKQAENKNEIETAKKLFLEYANWLNFDLCFQGFDKELDELPGKYAPPDGRLYLLHDESKIAGCIALRKLDESICEMKRLYIKPEFRGKGHSKLLVKKIIDDAKIIGYKKMRLDTIGDKMKEAISLYRSFGFYEIDAYYHNPQKGVVYMELVIK